MLKDARNDRLQQLLLTNVFGEGLTPQAALGLAIREDPDTPLLSWVFVTTTIAARLRDSFRPEDNWQYQDWLEAAASLACDVYALGELAIPAPTGHDLLRIWSSQDPHLR